MRLEKIAVCLVVALALSACATKKGVEVSSSQSPSTPSFSKEEVERWKEYYDQLQLSDKTAMERGLLSFPPARERMLEEKALAGQFPWIDRDHLSEKDRFFLLRVSCEGRPIAPRLILME